MKKKQKNIGYNYDFCKKMYMWKSFESLEKSEVLGKCFFVFLIIISFLKK